MAEIRVKDLRLEEGYFESAGISFHYYRSRAEGPPMVLLHGLTDDGSNWFPFAEAFKDEYDIIMPDAWAHGLSSAEGTRTMESLSYDTIAMMEQLKLGPAVVIGHSMGGNSAALLAGKRPDLVKSLILEDPAIFDSQPDSIPLANDDWVRSHEGLLQLSLSRVIEEGRKSFPHWSQQTLELWAGSKQRCRIEAFTLRGSPAPGFEETVSAIRSPSLLVIGDRQNIQSAESGARMKSLNPSFEVAQIPGAGHTIRFDRLPDFIELVRSYLASRA